MSASHESPYSSRTDATAERPLSFRRSFHTSSCDLTAAMMQQRAAASDTAAGTLHRQRAASQTSGRRFSSLQLAIARPHGRAPSHPGGRAPMSLERTLAVARPHGRAPSHPRAHAPAHPRCPYTHPRAPPRVFPTDRIQIQDNFFFPQTVIGFSTVCHGLGPGCARQKTHRPPAVACSDSG